MHNGVKLHFPLDTDVELDFGEANLYSLAGSPKNKEVTHGRLFSAPGVGVPVDEVGTELPLRVVLKWNAGRSWVASVFINTLCSGQCFAVPLLS